MIPLQLTLKNFLSYRQASIDFSGLHTACICGQNGAGKSSLLEAITWVIWGKTRAATEDDVIHIGEKDVRVDFELMSNYQHYKIIRSRTRGKSSALDFQIKNEIGKFISLSGKGLRNTQEQIINELKLDYETFINSAYLRQGKADEFMTKTPAERKKVLAELLNLDQYQKLAERAKDQSKQLKGKVDELAHKLETESNNLPNQKELELKQESAKNEINDLQKQEEIDKEIEQKLRTAQLRRDNQQEQINREQGQLVRIQQEGDRLQQEANKLQQDLLSLEQLLSQENEINQNHQKLLDLRKEQDKLSKDFQTYQQLKEQQQQLEKQLNQQINQLNIQLKSAESKLENLEQQEQDNKSILAGKADLEPVLIKLQEKRNYLQQLDELQTKNSPLIRQRQNLETEIEKVKSKFTLKLEHLAQQKEEINQKISKIPEQKNELLSLDQKLNNLDNKKQYLKRVETKTIDQEKSINLLQQQQNNCQELIKELEQKLHLLQKPDSICPLCERELDEHHRHTVVTKTEKQYQENQNQTWVIKEQVNTCQRELQKLINEQENINQELAEYEKTYQRFIYIETQLEETSGLNKLLEDIKLEIETLEGALHTENYAEELQKELQQINQELTELNYNEENHVLIRKEVDNLRWAEIKQSKIKDAARRQDEIEQTKPEIITLIATLQQQIQELTINSDIQEQLNNIKESLEELNYSANYHNQVVANLREAQNYEITYQKLQQAKQQYPQRKQRQEEINEQWQERETEKLKIKEELDRLTVEISLIKDYSNDLHILSEKMRHRRQELNNLLAEKGKIEQSLKQIEQQKIQNEAEYKRLQGLKKQYRVYLELSQAFGKNGIQALMIENILPQLEAESNHILSRLTGNQFHVQFLTQKTSKSASKKSSKLLDTLDILISDTQGTRTYETYSGGEAFRINFSIRLALAKLLAQKAGTALQMLIIDEGFGTQDGEGCDRLIAAINAISNDFSCILAVTHISQFKEAFQTRIEIEKTNQGSQIRLSI
jgi:exonuclease SbcC